MRIYILTDLEGPAMISTWAQAADYTPEEKKRSEYFLTGEVNACVDGIFAFDPEAEVIVWDGHGGGGIDEMLFHPRAKLIAGRGLRPPYFLDKTFDAVMFVGQHAKMGDRGTLCHTYNHKTIEYYNINGVEMGEFGCRALMAGTMSVPTVFVSGDDMAVAEARELIPNIVGAPVKWSLGRELAMHLSHEAACQLIREKAREACAKISQIEPYFFAGPYTFEARFQEGHGIHEYLWPGAEMIDERTVRIIESDICKLPI